MKDFKGVKYTVDDDKLRAYMKLPPLDKLKWLDELARFNELALSPEAKKIREMFRRGEI